MSKRPPDQEVSDILRAANLALVSSLSLDAVLQALLDFLGRLVPYDTAHVMLMDEDSRLRVKAARGHERWGGAEQVWSVSFDSRSNPIWSAMLASRESVLIPDTELHPGWERPAASAHVRSWMGVPLAAGGEVIGFYSVDKAEPGFFSAEHLRLTEALAPHAAAAIRNARLFEQAQANEARLRLTVDALRLSEERFARAFRASPAAMSISALADGRYLDVNDRFLQLVGYSREEVVGRTGVELAFWADPDDRRQAIELLREAGTLRDLELRVRTKSGERRDVLLSLELLELGGESCLLGLSQDVTDRKRAEQEAQRRQAEQQVILDAVPAMIWYKDTHNRILRANRAAAEALGLPPEDIEGRSAYTLQPDEAAQYYEEDLEVIHTGRAKLAVVEPFTTTAGAKRLIHADRIPYRDDEGTIIGVIVFAVDITERKRLEDKLRQSQKLEAVGRLAGGVAHDFNNLMTAILGYSDLLLARFDEADPSRRHVLEIARAGGRIASLTRQLLAFGRKQVLVPQVVDLNALVTDSEGTLRGLLGPSVALATSLDAGLGRVRADPAQIQQVLVNLVVNARDAMPEGGHVTVETRGALPGEADLEGRHVVLSVSDTGVGMDEDTRGHLFEPFFTTKGRAKAAGLGLATVYGIVKQTGGHVAVSSEPGHGTTFSVFLPRLDGPGVAAAASARAEDAAGGAETILLVEDEAQVRNLTREILETAGYRVLEAANGSEALRVADEYQHAIDLMLTDVVMPGMSGRELAERLTPLRTAMKILYTSGHTDDAIVQHGVLDPAVPFIPKPFTPVELTAKVRELLGRP